MATAPLASKSRRSRQNSQLFVTAEFMGKAGVSALEQTERGTSGDHHDTYSSSVPASRWCLNRSTPASRIVFAQAPAAGPTGLVWRARDPHNYYVVRANALEDNVVLYKTVKSQRSALDIVGRKGGYGVNVPVPAQSWHRLKVEFVGTRFKVLFNEKPIFEVEDTTFGEAGLIGLWTKADSVTSFADFVFEQMR
jgi:hypothetical protein